MTPSATAPDARGTAGTARTAGHRGTVRKSGLPRRVSGPAGGVTAPRPAAVPSRRDRRPRRRATTRPVGRSLPARAVAVLAAIPDHPLLDRIVRGRAWIPILGILLAGIVAMQVEVLKLSANMGRSIEQSTALQSRNQQLRQSVAELSDPGRIEQLATGMGMVMPDPATIDFLTVRPGDTARRALANIHPPDPAGFTASLPPVDSSAGATGATGATPSVTGATPSVTGATPSVTGAPTQQTTSSGAAPNSTTG